MGNTQSQKKSDKPKDMFFNEELINSIDVLASKLIFEESFQNLLKLQDPRYCDEISVLTHRLLKKKLTPINVNMVTNRVKFGSQNRDLYTITEDSFKKMKNINDKNYNKNEMCLNVSKFYTRVFQAYSAIVTAINPIHIYKNIEGDEKIRSVFDEISDINKKKSDIGLRSLCSRRIFHLKPTKMGDKQMTLDIKNCKMNKKGEKLAVLTREHVNKQVEKHEESVETTEQKEGAHVEPAPEVPIESKKTEEEENKTEEKEKKPEEKEKKPEEEEVVEEKKPEEEEVVVVENKPEEEVVIEKKEDDNQKGGEKEAGEIKMTSELIETMTLADEPGIKSLENLYKDKMELVTEGTRVKGEFVMSDKSKKLYEKDLKEFYKAFVPDGKKANNIKKFSQITLIDYSKTDKCAKGKETAVRGDSAKREDSLFVEYGKHFQTMIKNVKERETELIDHLHLLFDFDLKKEVPILIKKDLTEDKLNETIIPGILKTIKKMYIDCESDFQKGLAIYNKIYMQRNNL